MRFVVALQSDVENGIDKVRVFTVEFECVVDCRERREELRRGGNAKTVKLLPLIVFENDDVVEHFESKRFEAFEMLSECL